MLSVPTHLRRATGDIVLDPSEVVFAQRFGPSTDFEPSVNLHMRTGAVVIAVGDSAPELWEWLAKSGDDGPATGDGDGVLIRRPGTAPALVIYAENGDSFAASWDEAGVHTNVFLFGLDPRKTWTLEVDGSRSTIFPNPADGHWQAPFPPKPGRHSLLLQSSSA